MHSLPVPATPGTVGADLDESLQRLEQHLDDLQAGLGARDLPAIELHAGALHSTLSQVAVRLAHAARGGQASHSLQGRLGVASVRVAAQRDALARATAVLERAMHLLMPIADPALYSASGTAQHLRNAAALQA
jgi:hypothetical protein